MYKYHSYRTLRIKKLLVAIIAVLLALALMTTISYNAALTAFAVGEETEKTESTESTESGDSSSGSEETKTEEKTSEESSSENKESSEKKENSESTEESTENAEVSSEGTAEGNPEGAQAIEDLLIEDDSESVIDYGKSQATIPTITSSSYIVMSGSTSEVVTEQHAQRKMSPGRITMLMTAMVAIDCMYNEDELNNTVEITDKIAKNGDLFKEGESVTVRDLLKAMLIGGSEEAAEALSRYSASKRSVFINLMNSKAMELGLLDTNFTNPTGEYTAKHYSTASDCAIITQAAVRYQIIKDILELKRAEFNVTTKDSTRVVGVRSTNPLFTTTKPSELYKYVKGGISGTLTEPSKATQYAGIANVDDMQLIVILMDSRESKVPYEAKGLFEYGDSNVTRNIIVKANKNVGSARIRYGADTKVPVYTETKGFAYVPPEGSDDLIRTEIFVESNLEAPLKDGDKVGEYRIYVADELKGTVDLVIHRDIPRGWYLSRFYISNRMTIILGVILGIILLVILRIIYVRKRNQRIHRERREERLREIAMQQMEIDEDRRRRNWTYTTSYDKVAPRTSDLRREAIEEELRKEELSKTSVRKQKKKSKADKKKAKQKLDKTEPPKTVTVIIQKPDAADKKQED